MWIYWILCIVSTIGTALISCLILVSKFFLFLFLLITLAIWAHYYLYIRAQLGAYIEAAIISPLSFLLHISISLAISPLLYLLLVRAFK